MVYNFWQQWHSLIKSFLILTILGTSLGFLSLFLIDSSWSLPDGMIIAFIFGGCPAILWLIGVFLYFGVGNLYRYTPPDAEPELAPPRLTKYLVWFYIILVVVFFIAVQVIWGFPN